ncbi:MAG: serine protease [Vicinamibacterales bacterium]
MSVRRTFVLSGLIFSLAALAFSFGSWTTQRAMAEQLAQNEARLAALSTQFAQGTAGSRRHPDVVAAGGEMPASLVDEIKRQIQAEMGLLPVQLLRDRRNSFVELNAYDNNGKASYGTAGYLGNGYFITVKHGVVPLDEPPGSTRRFEEIKLRINGKDVSAKLVDSGDAPVEVHAGDWAILKVRGEVDLPPLRVNTNWSYEFASPIFRLGNDYSKGIILATGYIGQRTGNGLVTALTDGHPGVSGGGVLDQTGDLVGIPVGRMQGDFRFSFILPLRDEMFRTVEGASFAAETLAANTAH